MNQLSHVSLLHSARATGSMFGNEGVELSEGSVGSAVRELQSKLNVLQYGPLVVDGSFQASTVLALRNFQSVEQLPVTGRLDAATSARLDVRVLNVQRPMGDVTTAPAAVDPTTGALVPSTQTPFWQTALMIAGGVALVGGVIYLLSDKGEQGYQRAMNRGGMKDAFDKAHAKREHATAHALKASEGVSGTRVQTPREKPCKRAPDANAFAKGEPLSAPEVTP